MPGATEPAPKQGVRPKVAPSLTLALSRRERVSQKLPPEAATFKIWIPASAGMTPDCAEGCSNAPLPLTFSPEGEKGF